MPRGHAAADPGFERLGPGTMMATSASTWASPTGWSPGQVVSDLSQRRYSTRTADRDMTPPACKGRAWYRPPGSFTPMFGHLVPQG
jgi:hypothetical protein